MHGQGWAGHASRQRQDDAPVDRARLHGRTIFAHDNPKLFTSFNPRTRRLELTSNPNLECHAVRVAAPLPSGSVTFLLTDIEGPRGSSGASVTAITTCSTAITSSCARHAPTTAGSSSSPRATPCSSRSDQLGTASRRRSTRRQGSARRPGRTTASSACAWACTPASPSPGTVTTSPSRSIRRHESWAPATGVR